MKILSLIFPVPHFAQSWKSTANFGLLQIVFSLLFWSAVLFTFLTDEEILGQNGPERERCHPNHFIEANVTWVCC